MIRGSSGTRSRATLVRGHRCGHPKPWRCSTRSRASRNSSASNALEEVTVLLARLDGDVDIIPRFPTLATDFAAGNIAGYAAQLDHIRHRTRRVGVTFKVIDLSAVPVVRFWKIRRVSIRPMETPLYCQCGVGQSAKIRSMRRWLQKSGCRFERIDI